mmetsp:Transcript_118394/g.342310  ORF Transcript_118394/g.342310 Transcript_118394/m.342310 type:complete len:298 (+) Transcript_118394:27-920(+)
MGHKSDGATAIGGDMRLCRGHGRGEKTRSDGGGAHLLFFCFFAGRRTTKYSSGISASACAPRSSSVSPLALLARYLATTASRSAGQDNSLSFASNSSSTAAFQPSHALAARLFFLSFFAGFSDSSAASSGSSAFAFAFFAGFSGASSAASASSSSFARLLFFSTFSPAAGVSPALAPSLASASTFPALLASGAGGAAGFAFAAEMTSHISLIFRSSHSLKEFFTKFAKGFCFRGMLLKPMSFCMFDLVCGETAELGSSIAFMTFSTHDSCFCCPLLLLSLPSYSLPWYFCASDMQLV